LRIIKEIIDDRKYNGAVIFNSYFLTFRLLFQIDKLREIIFSMAVAYVNREIYY